MVQCETNPYLDPPTKQHIFSHEEPIFFSNILLMCGKKLLGIVVEHLFSSQLLHQNQSRANWMSPIIYSEQKATNLFYEVNFKEEVKTYIYQEKIE